MKKAAPALLAALLLTACGSAPAPHHTSTPPARTKATPVHLAVKVLPGLPSARAGLGAAMVNGTIWVVGGLTATDASSSTIWAYDPAKGVTGTWNLPFKTHDLSAVAKGTSVYIVGGGRFTSLNTFGEFSLPPKDPLGATVSFTNTGTTPQPYSDAWAGLWNGRLTIVGGYNDKTASNRVWQHVAGTWVAQATLPVGVRYAAVAVSQQGLYVVGGFDGNNSGAGSQTSGVYLVSRSGTVTRAATLPQPLERAGAAVMGGTLFVFGGYNGTSYSSAILALDLATGSWTTVGHLPEPWAYGAVVKDGASVYLIGGQNAAGSLRSVWNVTAGK